MRAQGQKTREGLLREAQAGAASAVRNRHDHRHRGQLRETQELFDIDKRPGEKCGLGSAGRWGEAKAVAEKFQLGYEHLLYRALSEGAPSDVIVELVESNGTLPDDAITTIASKSLNLKGWSGAAELARTLVQTHGLDVHFVDQQGRNALTIAAEYFYDIPGWDANRDSFELIEFLLDQSVTTKPDARSLDALDRILLAILDRPETVRAGIELLRYLIGRGAPVELSHRQVAQIISVSNAQAHARLIEAVPELL